MSNAIYHTRNALETISSFLPLIFLIAGVLTFIAIIIYFSCKRGKPYIKPPMYIKKRDGTWRKVK